MFSKRTLHLTILSLILLGTLACNLTKKAAPTSNTTPSPDNIPDTLPTVTIITPVDGATVPNGRQVDIRAVVADTGGGVTRVELHVDGSLAGRVEPPDGPQIYWTVQQAWTPQEAGTHSIEVIAYRGEVASRPAPLTLNVQGAAPTTAPGASASGGCTATVNASAGLRVRGGPGTVYAHLYSLPHGTTVPITGRVGDNSWWQVRASDGLVGWVAAEYTDPSGDCRRVPVVQPPPPPTAAPDAAQHSAAPAANLQVSNIEGPSEVTLASGSVTATFVITIQNTGTAESGQFNLSFYSHGRTGSATPQTITAASLKPGETITAIVSGTYSAAGQYTAEAVVDSGQEVAESNEGDNVRAFGIKIKN